MKALASICFGFLFLANSFIPNMDLACELKKLPNLFTHYEEHKTCSDNSVWQFLVDHYLNIHDDSDGHHDQSSHENLPFHGNHHCGHTPVFYASEVRFSVMEPVMANQTKFSFYRAFHSSEYLPAPFQPPRA